jgi:hypothetical protein
MDEKKAVASFVSERKNLVAVCYKCHVHTLYIYDFLSLLHVYIGLCICICTFALYNYISTIAL